MASNILSRLLPSASDERSIYDGDRGQRRRSETAESEQHLGLDIDEENLGERFQDQDLEHLLADAAASHITTESTAFLPQSKERMTQGQHKESKARSEWLRSAPPRGGHLDDDDDVPESLLLEGVNDPPASARLNDRRAPTDGLPPPVPGPPSRRIKAQWEATRTQQRLHVDGQNAAGGTRSNFFGKTGQLSTDPKERAMWMWVNVQDLDAFLVQVYEYFVGHGIWSILLHKALTLLQSAFVVGFLTFLFFCIDYAKVPQSKSMDEILVPQCTTKIHGLWTFLLFIFALSWTYGAVSLVRDIHWLWSMHNFYHHLLDIPDRNIQTVSWQLVVSRLMALRDANYATAQNLSPETRRILQDKSKQRMDAHDIANRLMRRENYLIALFNKEILDVTMHIPFLGNRYFFSRTTEWHVGLSIMDFVFPYRNQIDPKFLKESHRRHLVEQLKRRLFLTGLISIICAPFAVVFFCVSYFFKYFTEYHKDPSQLGSRMFTPLAEWKFREFNELRHLFERRRNMAYPYADRYLAQFPKDKTEQASSFVAFVAGAFAAVLALFTIFDSELFLGFEITPGKNVIFYLGVLGVIYRVARSSSPQDDLVLDPRYALTQVIECIRYEPASWKNRLHSDEVRNEFSSLYQVKVVIFAEEILSMIITPFILMFRLPHCSERIVDFFREFTVHVDGLGHVCSFAVFDFKRGGESAPVNRTGDREDSGLREDYYTAKDNKMLASYYGFLDNYAPPGRGQNYGRVQARTQFHPPPVFPNAFTGMSSHAADAGGRSNSRGPAGRQPTQRRTPRHMASVGRASPINSILLDPHHQPSMSALRNSPRQTAQSKYRTPLQPVSDPDELDEAEPGPGQNPNRVIEEDSSFGDSWRTTRLAQTEDENEEEAPDDNRGGVLGLLYQFQKAQTEGRGVGVGI